MNPFRVISQRLASNNFSPRERAALFNQLPPPEDKVIKVLRHNEHIYTSYSPETFEMLFGIPYLPYMTFTSEELLHRTLQRCPWLFRLGLLGMETDPLYEEYRSKIWNAHVADVTIGWINDILGYGLFANESFDKDAFIGTYTGVVRPLSRQEPDHNPYCVHYPTRFWSWWLLVIDGGQGGNELRFANHSDNPNMSLECLYDRGLLHFFLKAKQTISKGAHLTFDYGEAFWNRIPLLALIPEPPPAASPLADA